MTTPSSEDKTVAEAMPFDAFQIRSFTARASSVGDAHELSGDSIYEFARMLWGAFVAHNRTALAASGSKGGDERAAFEAWFPTEWSTTMKRRPDGTYVEPFVEDCWATWQARAAAPAEQSAAMLDGQQELAHAWFIGFGSGLNWKSQQFDYGPDTPRPPNPYATPAAVQTKGKDDSPTQADYCRYGVCKPGEQHDPGCVEYAPGEMLWDHKGNVRHAAVDRLRELQERKDDSPSGEALDCPACHGSGVIQINNSDGLADQFGCDLCGNAEENQRG